MDAISDQDRNPVSNVSFCFDSLRNIAIIDREEIEVTHFTNMSRRCERPCNVQYWITLPSVMASTLQGHNANEERASSQRKGRRQAVVSDTWKIAYIVCVIRGSSQ